MILLNKRQLKMSVREWGIRYNRERPHSSLGPGIPEPNQGSVPASDYRHKLPAGYRVEKTPVLGGLHHEYSLVKEAAYRILLLSRTTGLDMFIRWFEYHFHSMLVDFCDDPLIQEEI